MSSVAARRVPLARHRLLGLLGIERHAQRGRFAPAARGGRSISASSIVLIDPPDAAAHPLLRAILAALDLDPSSIRVAGVPLPGEARVLLSIGACDTPAMATAPALATLAGDPDAKRALWRSLRPLLRNA